VSAPRRVAVVGAGIAGLSAAFDLVRAGVEVTVFDPADVAGGKLRTSPFAGIDLDESADMFLARLPWGVQLCRDLGLEASLISPTIGSAMVVQHGALHRLPEGLVLGVPADLDALRASGLVSEAGVQRVAEDIDRPEGAPDGAELDGDVAVGELVRARIGDEAFEVLVDPLLSGVNAGRADELSADLGAAQLLAAARQDRSLIRALRAQLPSVPAGGERPPIFVAVPGGMGRLVAALVEAIGSRRIRLGEAVETLGLPADGGIELQTGSGTEPFDAVVLATPAPVTAALVAPHAPGTAATLAGLAHASVAIVALAYHRADLPGALDASGFLVPRSEGRLLTACSWASSKFPHLGADGLVRLRASVGRSDDTRFVGLDDAEVIACVRDELAALMGVTAEPVAARVHRWIDALPQYRPGHRRRIDAAEAELAAAAPAVVLAGASLRGLGVPACIDSGRRAARTLLG